MMNLPKVPPALPPSRPQNALHSVAAGIGSVVGLPGKAVDLLNQGFATATNSIAQMLPCFPAATMFSIAVGIPHAHIAHPPSGPPPVPPTPIPPVGPVMLGNCVQVLINSKPAARCGDLGFNPTCCGLPPMFEIFTGSSKVFIGGGRAARMTDITYHCKPVPPAGAASRGTAAAMKTSMKAAAMAMMVAEKAMTVMQVAGVVAQASAIAGDVVEAVDTPDAAMSSALGLNAAMMAAQMAADAAAMAAGNAMGKDPCVPPGTLGAIVSNCSPDVVIGGFPMPSWMSIAKGLMKLVKGLRKRVAERQARKLAGVGH